MFHVIMESSENYENVVYKTWNIQILLTNHGLVTKKVAGQFGLVKFAPERAQWLRVAGQLGLKSSRPLSQLGLGQLGPVYFQSVQLCIW